MLVLPTAGAGAGKRLGDAMRSLMISALHTHCFGVGVAAAVVVVHRKTNVVPHKMAEEQNPWHPGPMWWAIVVDGSRAAGGNGV